MTDVMKRNINEYSNIIQTLLLSIIVPLLGANLIATSDHTARLAVLEYERSIGSRYTAEMAAEDLLGVVERVNDHELRIRKVEQR